MQHLDEVFELGCEGVGVSLSPKSNVSYRSYVRASYERVYSGVCALLQPYFGDSSSFKIILVEAFPALLNRSPIEHSKLVKFHCPRSKQFHRNVS